MHPYSPPVGFFGERSGQKNAAAGYGDGRVHTELKTVCTRTAPQWDFLGSEADKKMPLPDMGMGGCIRNYK